MNINKQKAIITIEETGIFKASLIAGGNEKHDADSLLNNVAIREIT